MTTTTADLTVVPGGAPATPRRRTRKPKRWGPYDWRPETAPTPLDDGEARHGIAPELVQLAHPVDDLQPYQGNPRRGNVEGIGRSLARNGQYRPIVVNRGTYTGRRHEILAGNHTTRGAEFVGWTHVAVTWLDVDDDDAARVVLADNKLGDDATYDDDALLALVGSLADDLDGTGWSSAEYDKLLAAAAGDDPVDDVDDDELPPMPEVVVTRRGDVWQLGPHRLICGDARDPGDVEQLLAGAAINLAFTSPPYADARKYDEASEFRPIPPEEYVEWFDAVQANVAEHLAPDGSWFVNAKAKGEGLDTPLWVLDLVIAHVRRWGWHFATEFCWERHGMPKSVTRRFKNQFEPIYQFARGEWKMRPQAVMHASDGAITPLGKGAGDTSWADGHEHRSFDASRKGPGMAYPGNRIPQFTTETTGHTAAFPVGLPAWFMRAYTDPGDVVYDPFMGAGTTIIAAHREGRIGYGCEISPKYCDLICTRYQRITGQLPVLVSTGESRSFL